MTMPRNSHASAAGGSLMNVNRFVVAFASTEISFSEMTGITSEIVPSEYFSSSRGGVSLSKQFGLIKPAIVVLKRGVDQDLSLWTWHQEALSGNPAARKPCSLMLLDSMNTPKQSYRLQNAWPSKLEISGFKAGGGDPAVATVTLTCEQIDITGAGGG